MSAAIDDDDYVFHVIAEVFTLYFKVSGHSVVAEILQILNSLSQVFVEEVDASLELLGQSQYFLNAEIVLAVNRDDDPSLGILKVRSYQRRYAVLWCRELIAVGI